MHQALHQSNGIAGIKELHKNTKDNITELL